MLDLNRKMARGALWMGLMRLSVRTLSIISTLILARLLVPADFGLVAMATSIVAFLELATAFSFDIPLIQNQQATRKHFDSAWTLNLMFFAGLTVVLVLLAVPAAAFYQDPRLTDVIYVLAGAFLVRGFENIGVVHFRKELNFRQDFLLMFSKKFVGFIVAIPLAFYFRNYWALIFGIIAGNLGGVVLSYLFHPFRPRFSLAAAGEMLSFSKWLILNNAISFLRTRSPDFVIGRLAGSSALGFFTVAYEISTLPTTELVAPINRAVFPGYSRISNDLKLLRQSYLDVVGVIALFALPAGFGISAVSAPLVDLALGTKWAEAAPIVALLAIFGGLNALHANNGSVYNAIGKPYLITILGSIHATLLLTASIILASRFGALGVAAAFVGTSIVFAPVSFYVAARQLGIAFADYVRVLWRPVSSSLLMFAAVGFLDDRVIFPAGAGPFKALLIMVPAGMLVYAGTVIVLWLLAGRPQTIETRLTGLVLGRLRSGFSAVRLFREQ